MPGSQEGSDFGAPIPEILSRKLTEQEIVAERLYRELSAVLNGLSEEEGDGLVKEIEGILNRYKEPKQTPA